MNPCALQPPHSLHTVRTRQGDMQVAEVRGPPGAQTVVVLHGTPGGYDTALDNAATYLTWPCRVLAPSRPGYQGTPLATGHTFSHQAKALTEAVEALKPGAPVLLALSGAAPLGMAVARRLRARPRGLALLSGVFEPIPLGPLSALEQLMCDPDAAPLVVALLHAAPERFVAHFHKLSAQQERALAFSEHRQRLCHVLDAMQPIEARLDGWHNDRQQLSEALDLDPAALTTPTLFVHGDHDRQAPHEAAARVAAAAGGQLYTVTGGDHFLDSTHLREVQGVIRAWAAALPLGGGSQGGPIPLGAGG